MAIQIKIPDVTFTDAQDLPVVRKDPILPATGALFLIDPTHPVQQWDAGVPANDATVPNIAWEQAEEILGGTEATLAGEIYNVGLTSTKGFVERSGMGGLHACVSPTYSFTNGDDGFNIRLPLTIYNYLRSVSDTHEFYQSIWTQPTRAASANSKAYQIISADAIQYFTRTTNTGVLFGDTIIDSNGSAVETVGQPIIRKVAGTAYSTFDTATSTNAWNRCAFTVGNHDYLNSQSGSRGQAGSRIFYRFYLEDLTVSGRTYSQVSAIDDNLFAAACSKVGGRYNSDTYTNPSTVP